MQPLANGRAFTSFRLPSESEAQQTIVLQYSVSPGFFETLRIPILAGRNFGPADSPGSVVLVNQALVNKYFPDGQALGKTIVAGTPRQIVGIVRNSHTVDVDAVDPMIYTPVILDIAPKLLVRNRPDLLAAVRRWWAEWSRAGVSRQRRSARILTAR
jgi:hypothetical protein